MLSTQPIQSIEFLGVMKNNFSHLINVKENLIAEAFAEPMNFEGIPKFVRNFSHGPQSQHLPISTQKIELEIRLSQES